MKFDRRLTDEIYTSDTVRLGKNAFQAMRETIYHNGGVSFRGASGEMILHRLDLKKIFISTGISMRFKKYAKNSCNQGDCSAGGICLWNDSGFVRKV